MRRDFTDRSDLQAYLRDEFPGAAAHHSELSPIPGGRAAAEIALTAFRSKTYANTRNYLDGNVSRLSPYFRHGVLQLSEALPKGDYKFIQELAWRDYWQRLYHQLGDGIWRDQEAYKTGHDASAYSTDLPPTVEAGETGLACMDAFAVDLRQTGYLHNHARMWMASYVVHWLRVRWQAGAKWFLRHLLDGDPASNNLSWQWVASTFSAKPYIFNRENLSRYTKNAFCPNCPSRNRCPFDADYPVLEERLFRIV